MTFATLFPFVCNYRYSFNGMEKDDEVKGNGSHLDFGARCYDSRLGRFLSLDPLAAKYSSISPYVFSLNNPNIFIDSDGREVIGLNGDPVRYKKGEGGQIIWSSNVTDDIKKLGRLMLTTEKGTDAWNRMSESTRKVHIHFISHDEEPQLNARMRGLEAEQVYGLTMSDIDYQKAKKGQTLTDKEVATLYEKENNSEGLTVKSQEWNTTHLLINEDIIFDEAKKDDKYESKLIKRGKKKSTGH